MHANASRRLYIRLHIVIRSPPPQFLSLLLPLSLASRASQKIGHAMTVEFKPRGRRSNVAILVRTASDSILVHPRTMYVIKRDGREEPVAFDKITARIKKLSYGLSAEFCDPVRARLCDAMRCGALRSMTSETARLRRRRTRCETRMHGIVSVTFIPSTSRSNASRIARA